MSHLSQYTTKLNDLESIKAACEELGLQFKEGGNVRWYGSSQRADFVISWAGSSYDVGLVKDPITGNYTLIYDTYTGQVEQKLGRGCNRLIDSANYHKVAKKALAYGYFVQRENTEDQAIEMVITR